MSVEIQKVSVRNALEPRREPYWAAPLDRGRHIGVRKLENGSCVWIAKLRDDDGKKRYRSLGQVTKTNDYSAAKKAAEDWFASFDAGVTDRPPTVADACREYVAGLEADGRGATAKGDRRKDPEAVPGWGAAHDAEMRFRRLIYDQPIGKVPLDKLRTAKLREWRNGIKGSKDSQNRNWEALRAALYFAISNRRVHPSLAQELRDVKKHRNAKRRRGLYLDLEQRRALLKACEGAVRNLVEAAMLTGARPGELVSMKRSQFDARTSTATFRGKTGTRAVPLSPAAVALFERLAKGKLPSAYLLTQDDGRPWGHSDWDELIREAATKAKLPKGVVLYTLRHSWITEALRAGMPTLDVARLTGTSLAMIEQHYGHLVAEAARERLAAVEML
ncbi:MAG TPA: tyrosine-type recombinase/integrase [Gammaproteobacteria bacterium]